nr:retrovirus-related Pol polyprotein from transposon TNT 1-94 [Tanacetum cinerariifolium]
MLNEQSLPQKFWCKVVDTSSYILNRILIRAILGKTPYELLRCKKTTLDYFRVFGSKCFILNTKDYLTKFDPNSYEGVFLGYSQDNKAYIVLNKHYMKIEESLNVTFDGSPPPSNKSPLVDDDLDEEKVIKVTEKRNIDNNIEDETLEIDEIVNIKESKNHPLENVIGNLNQITLRSERYNLAYFIAKRIELVTTQPRLIMPYDMLLTRLFKHVMTISHGLLDDYYDFHDRVMHPLTAQQERKTRKDYETKRGRHFTSSSFAFGQPSSSHLNDDDDNRNGEGTLRASTSSLTRFVNSLTNEVPRVFENPQNVDLTWNLLYPPKRDHQPSSSVAI